MADSVTTQTTALASLPTGTKIATDDAGAGGHVQIVKIADPTNGSAAAWGDGAAGLPVEITNPGDISGGSGSTTVTRIQVTPTISTSAYTAKDNVGGLLTFSGAAGAGMAIRVVSVQVVDKDAERADMDLVLFDRSITTPTDNAVFDPTDAELSYVIGVIPLGAGSYAEFNDNAVLDLPWTTDAVLNGTDLFGVLVARGTPTYTATNDLVVTVTVRQL